MRTRVLSLLTVLAFAVATGVHAQEPVKIGFITTLSGPAGYLGQDIRDAFQLATDLEGGKLGGIAVRLIVEDDGLKPGQGKQIADKLLKNDQVKLFTGIVFSNVAGAAVPDILDAKAIYVSANAGPSIFAGKECHKNYFVVSYQNDAFHESAGQLAENLGFKRAFLLAPNYQAGKDSVQGFKRFFKGQVVGEIYTRLDQTDFAPEMAQVRAANPDVVFQFHPGGLGIAFLRQYQQAGLLDKFPMVVPGVSADHSMLKALGDAAVGVNATTHWNADFDNEANRKFVAEFQKKYGRVPTIYAAQGYDTAHAIGAALKAIRGDLSDTDAFRREMLKAKFHSVRGAFKFGPNQHPLQEWWATKVERGNDGKLDIVTKAKVFESRGDNYAANCKL